MWQESWLVRPDNTPDSGYAAHSPSIPSTADADNLSCCRSVSWVGSSDVLSIWTPALANIFVRSSAVASGHFTYGDFRLAGLERARLHGDMLGNGLAFAATPAQRPWTPGVIAAPSSDVFSVMRELESLGLPKPKPGVQDFICHGNASNTKALAWQLP